MMRVQMERQETNMRRLMDAQHRREEPSSPVKVRVASQTSWRPPLEYPDTNVRRIEVPMSSISWSSPFPGLS